MSDFEIIERPAPRLRRAVPKATIRALVETAGTAMALAVSGMSTRAVQSRFRERVGRLGFEFHIQKIGNRRYAVWAERRNGDRP